MKNIMNYDVFVSFYFTNLFDAFIDFYRVLIYNFKSINVTFSKYYNIFVTYALVSRNARYRPHMLKEACFLLYNVFI